MNSYLAAQVVGL